MKIFKFMISPDTWVQDPENPALSYKGCVAAVVAEDPQQARELLTGYAAQNGYDVGWLRAARVVELPITNGTFIAWAQV